MIRYLLIASFVLVAVSSASADITSWYCADDGDGAILPAPGISWGESEPGLYDMTYEGIQKWAPAHLVGWFNTDTPADPNIRVTNIIDNDMSFTWTDYHFNVTMNTPFSIFSNSSNIISPGGWSYVVTQPTQDGSAWTGTVDYYYAGPGTGIDPGDAGTFGYKISFEGSTSYSYTQEMIPTPEPATIGLLAMGGMALLRRRRK